MTPSPVRTHFYPKSCTQTLTASGEAHVCVSVTMHSRWNMHELHLVCFFAPSVSSSLLTPPTCPPGAS